MDDKKIPKRKERKAKTALEMLIIWMEYLTSLQSLGTCNLSQNLLAANPYVMMIPLSAMVPSLVSSVLQTQLCGTPQTVSKRQKCPVHSGTHSIQSSYALCSPHFPPNNCLHYSQAIFNPLSVQRHHIQQESLEDQGHSTYNKICSHVSFCPSEQSITNGCLRSPQPPKLF